MQEAIGNALLDLLITGFSEVEGGFKMAIYMFIETKHTDMAEKGVLGKVFDHSIDRWNQSTSFIVAFTSRALISLRFMRLVAQFIKTRSGKTGDERSLPAKADGFSSVEVGSSWPPHPPSSSSSDRSDRRKHRCKHQKANVPKVMDHTRNAKPKDRYSTESLDHDTRTKSSGHDFSIQDLSRNARSEEVSQPPVTARKKSAAVSRKNDDFCRTAVAQVNSANIKFSINFDGLLVRGSTVDCAI